MGHGEETPLTGQGERPWEESALLANSILDLQPPGLAFCFMTDTPTSAQTHLRKGAQIKVTQPVKDKVVQLSLGKPEAY